MTNEEIIKKINDTLKQVHKHFDNADGFWQDKFNENAPEKYKQDRHGLRNWLLDMLRQYTGNKHINMFSFDAEEIQKLRNPFYGVKDIKNPPFSDISEHEDFKLPSQLVGCSGRADLFAKYAAENGLNFNIVAMVDIADKNKERPNGHQIIAVNFPDGSQQLIDPGRGRETYEKALINGKCNVGEKISYNRRDGHTDYEITAILTPIEHAQIDSPEKLAQVYKNPQINPEAREKQAKIQEILKILHNNKNGFRGLLNNVKKKLSKEENEKYKSNEDYNDILTVFILKNIKDFKSGKKEYNQQEFEQSVLNELKTMLSLDEEQFKQYKKTQEPDLRNLDNMRFELTGDDIIKYRFFTSCANAADAFLAVNKTLPEPIPEEDISILNSTKFDHLLNGKSGHVIPCVKMPDGTWFAVDPQKTANGHFGFTIPEKEFAAGNKVFHLVGQRHQPYMIKLIGDANSIFHNHDDFLKQASRVPLGHAQMFIKQMGEQGYLSTKQCQQLQQEFAAERERRIKSLRLATDKLGKQVQLGPYVSMDELKKAQAQQAYLGYGNLHE